MAFRKQCVLLATVSLIISIFEAQNISVVTQAGEFVGFKKIVDVDGTDVVISKFLGIPYAEPPVGDLRFRKSVAKAALSEPWVAHEYGTECIQVNLLGVTRSTSEDCLFLNIYAPEKAPTDPSLAVMIFIHGGAYVLGSSNSYVSDMLAARGGVIVITINYRLTILGFLNVQDNSPSNFGLWDQHLAIKWVHVNIKAFGGDTNRITIFGESAGAGSVIYQGIYPGNRGLFHRIIAQSGTAPTQWGEAQRPLDEAKQFGSLVGCQQQLPSDLVSCLRGIPADVISATLNDFGNGLLSERTLFVPSPDNEFVSISPRIILNRDEHDLRATQQRTVFAEFDLMMGVNSGEGAYFLSPWFGVYGDSEQFLPNRSYFEDALIPICARSEYGKNVSDAVSGTLVNVYTAWQDPENPIAIREMFIDMQRDVQFLAPMMKTIELYTNVSSKSPYVYYFTATPSKHVIPKPTWVDRAEHLEELLYVFGGENVFKDYGFTPLFKDWEKDLAKTVIAMWSNFAKTGNPNTPSDSGVDWKPYTSSKHSYLNIGKYLNQTVTKERLFEQYCHLWNSVLPRIHQETSQSSCGI